MAEETDLVASEVSIFPLFSVLVLTPQTGQSWKAGKDGGQMRRICKHRRERDTERVGGRTGQWC